MLTVWSGPSLWSRTGTMVLVPDAWSLLCVCMVNKQGENRLDLFTFNASLQSRFIGIICLLLSLPGLLFAFMKKEKNIYIINTSFNASQLEQKMMAMSNSSGPRLHRPLTPPLPPAPPAENTSARRDERRYGGAPLQLYWVLGSGGSDGVFVGWICAGDDEGEAVLTPLHRNFSTIFQRADPERAWFSPQKCVCLEVSVV